MVASQRSGGCPHPTTTQTGALTDVVNAKNGKTLLTQNAKNQDSVNMDVGFKMTDNEIDCLLPIIVVESHRDKKAKNWSRVQMANREMTCVFLQTGVMNCPWFCHAQQQMHTHTAF